MEHVGKSPSRPDGLAKVSGEARYTDDLVLPGMFHGVTIRSPHPHARIKKIRWNPKMAPHGAHCVTADGIPGRNGILLLDDTWPALADSVVCHVGEAVALIAAPTRMAARKAIHAAEVEYEPLPPILTWDDARAVEPLSSLDLDTGDVDEGFKQADTIVEGEYRTGHQEHIYIEPHAVIASFDDDGTLRVIGSMQCPFFVVKALMNALDLPQEKVRVEPAAVGGGFGGKEDYPSMMAVHAALLARACGHPVKMVYDRHEDIIGTTKRHPSLIKHRTGVSRDGRLLAMDIEVLLDGGAYRTLSPVVLSRAVLHATGPYRCPNVRIRGRVLRTNTATNGAFRGFGAPQVQFASERQMDRIARTLGLDPYGIREWNVLDPGDELATGQVLDASASARLCLETVERETNFRERWKELESERANRRDGESLRGIGLSLYFHGAGFTGMGEKRMRSPVTLRLREDGRIEILTAMTDMGQGSAVVLPQIAAEAAGVALEDVAFPVLDTGEVPDSGPTVASRTTMVVGGTIARAAAELCRRLLDWLSRVDGERKDIEIRDGCVFDRDGEIETFREIAQRYLKEEGPLEVTVHHEPPEWQVFDEKTYHGAAYATYGWGADVVEVEVDPDTFEVHPVKATIACEVGKAIHKTLCRGQIEGGMLQAMGFALMEEMKMDRGRYVNDRLSTYIIPTVMDTPPMDVHVLENPWEGGPFGAKGIGELPMDGGAPAAVQAIENATGIVPTEVPATPERLLQWSPEERRVPRGQGPVAEKSNEDKGDGETERS
jgi:CO/xanthine dehydrogenase Mo-binding subunit